MEIISSQPFSMASFSVNDSQLPAGIVISSGGEPAGMGQRFWALMKRRAERSPATMGLPHFGVRFLHSVETLHRVSKSAEVGL